MAETMLSQDEVRATLVKIEYRSRQALHPIARYITSIERQPHVEGQHRTEIGFIPRSKVAREAPGFKAKSTSSTSQKPISASTSRPKSTESSKASRTARDDLLSLGVNPKRISTPAFQEDIHQLPRSKRTGTSPSSNPAPGLEETSYKAPPRSRTTSSRQTNPASRSPSSSHLESQTSTLIPPVQPTLPSRTPSASDVVMEDAPEDKLVIMRPGEYRVCLAIDHRERKSASQLEIKVDGVETLVLPLLLADAVWYVQLAVALCITCLKNLLTKRQDCCS